MAQLTHLIASTARRHRRGSSLLAVLITGLFSLGFLMLAPSARASGLCGAPPFGSTDWSVVNTVAGGDLEIQMWMNRQNSQWIGRVANLVADGKYDVSVESGTSPLGNNRHDLGYGNSIGSAPSGGWCGNSTSPQIWVAITWYTYGEHHWIHDYCYGGNAGYFCNQRTS